MQLAFAHIAFISIQNTLEETKLQALKIAQMAKFRSIWSQPPVWPDGVKFQCLGYFFTVWKNNLCFYTVWQTLGSFWWLLRPRDIFLFSNYFTDFYENIGKILIESSGHIDSAYSVAPWCCNWTLAHGRSLHLKVINIKLLGHDHFEGLSNVTLCALYFFKLGFTVITKL